jgi:hypothetical protein
LEACTCGDDQGIVGKQRSIGQRDAMCVDRDRLDLALVEDDAVVQLTPAGTHDLVHVGEAERNEQQTGLVDVLVVEVDDVDLDRVGIEGSSQPVRDHGATGARSKNHNPPHRHALISFGIHPELDRERRPGHRWTAGCGCGQLRKLASGRTGTIRL